MNLLYFYFFSAIFVSFLCSLLESVLLSVSPAYISVALKEGKKTAERLKRFKKEINRPLAAILTLNTFANMVGAAGVGAQTLKVFGNEFVAIASVILTFVILIFSEIIPKTLGANHWKKLAPACANIIWWLILLTFPFVLLAEYISQLLSNKNAQQITRDEIIETAEIGVADGSLRKNESHVIKNLLMLDKILVSDIMTPKSVIFSLPQEMTCDEVMKKHQPIRYSRIPVYNKTPENITGIAHRYKILEAFSDENENIITLSSLQTKADSVHQSINVSSVLDEFIKNKKHLFLVLDDYNALSGIVTLEDAIETLLGVEIVDEFDSVEDLRKYALELREKRHSYKK